MINIKSANARVPNAICTIARSGLSLLPLGIPFIDEALLGLLETDLLILGAKTGRGKTQACIEMAKYLSRRKRKVTFIALEAEEDEIEMRLLYQIETGLFFRDQAKELGHIINYRNWRLGLLDSPLARYKAEAYKVFCENYATLTTVYRDKSFGFKELEETIDEVTGNSDCVIIDHLHYLDIDDERDQYRAQSRLIKKIRSLNLFTKVPFIVAAHLRKDIETLSPTEDDFMGSSDIGKNATIAMMIAPAPNGYNAQLQTQDTLISLPKTRTGGFGNLVGVLCFSIQHQRYTDTFKLARSSYDGKKIEMLKDDEWPDWAKKRSY